MEIKDIHREKVMLEILWDRDEVILAQEKIIQELKAEVASLKVTQEQFQGE